MSLSNSSNNDSNKTATSRTRQELQFSSPLLRTVINTGAAFVADHSLDALTREERRVFGTRTHHNWTAGSLAGLATFVVLFGGMRLRSSGYSLRRLLLQP